jgi:hypothetical protein
MTFFTRILLLCFIGLNSSAVYSHPVSYQGGIGIMSYNSPRMNEVLLTYSVKPWFAIAHTYLRDSDSEFYVSRLNFLLQRWNEEDSQANIYLSAGSGVEKVGEKSKPAHLGEIVADWESRKYYSYLEHLYLRRAEQENTVIEGRNYNHTKARFGFAPFLADYDELNIWFIGQFEKSNNEDKIATTQFLRFYRKNVLWEIGGGFDGTFAFNFMIHI